MTAARDDSPPEDSDLDTFKQLCSLVGTWEDVNELVTVAYRMTAHGSVLVETWTWLKTGIESLTMYHLDSGSLIATHYCPVGNQPRLARVPSPEPTRVTFEFVSATNLPDPAADHCVAFWIQIESGDLFERSETYEEGGFQTIYHSTYKRAGGTETSASSSPAPRAGF